MMWRLFYFDRVEWKKNEDLCRENHLSDWRKTNRPAKPETMEFLFFSHFPSGFHLLSVFLLYISFSETLHSLLQFTFELGISNLRRRLGKWEKFYIFRRGNAATKLELRCGVNHYCLMNIYGDLCQLYVVTNSLRLPSCVIMFNHIQSGSTSNSFPSHLYYIWHFFLVLGGDFRWAWHRPIWPIHRKTWLPTR